MSNARPSLNYVKAAVTAWFVVSGLVFVLGLYFATRSWSQDLGASANGMVKLLDQMTALAKVSAAASK